MLSASPGRLSRNGQPFQVDGINDTTVIPFAFMSKDDATYRYHNHNFPVYAGDKETSLQASSYPDFWDQYFTAMDILGLNTVRLGAGDTWGEGWLRRTWADARGHFDLVFDSMIEAARKHGKVVVFVLGGIQGEPAPADSPLRLGTPGFSSYTKYAREVMAAKASARDVVIWDLYNEPDHVVQWRDLWRGDHLAFQKWVDALYDATIGSAAGALVLVGTGGMNIGWSSDSLRNGQPTRGSVWNRHFYASAEDDYLVANPCNWAFAAGAYLLFTEVGKNTTVPPWTIDYWPWFWEKAKAGGAGVIWMQLDRRPGYPLTQAAINNARHTHGASSTVSGAQPVPPQVREADTTPKTPLVPAQVRERLTEAAAQTVSQQSGSPSESFSPLVVSLLGIAGAVMAAAVVMLAGVGDHETRRDLL